MNNPLLFDCANPVCAVKVGVHSKHYPYCSLACQRRCTPRIANQRQTNIAFSVLAPRPRISRKHGEDRKAQTE